MNRKVLVYMDLAGIPHKVGTLWARDRDGRQSASFEYSPEWLANPSRFALEPALTLGTGPHHTTEQGSLFGSLNDSAPDRWGRALMRRSERHISAATGKPLHALLDIDYLLGVHDVSRLGALRFSDVAGGPFLAEATDNSTPPLIALPKLLAASEHIILDDESDEDLRLLLAPGSSLGGARPKASVIDSHGKLCIAKFPSPTDDWSVILWEAVALTLAEKAGIAVPARTIENVANNKILILNRFDRHDRIRIPFLSAMSMLSAQDHETRCYLEMADALRRWGAAPHKDMRALFRRIVFNILISNTDDHLRNHGFLFQDPSGWRLAPAYDLNPVPVDVKPRVLSTEIDFGNATASLDLAYRVAEYFELSMVEAKQVAREVGSSVISWRREAARIGIPSREVDRMASAFEHPDLSAATDGR